MTIRRFLVFLVLLILGTGCLHGQQKTTTRRTSDLLIDRTKPFVYIQVDHIGPREPAREEEPSTGVYFYVVNNCRVPVEVWAFDDSVMDRVVPNDQERNSREFTSTGFLLPAPATLFDGLPDSLLTPEMKKQKEALAEQDAKWKAAKEAIEKEAAREPMPNGYMFDVGTVIAIPPGKRLNFSLPISHVGDNWHVEIPFWFSSSRAAWYRQPKLYLELYKQDVMYAPQSSLWQNKR